MRCGRKIVVACLPPLIHAATYVSLRSNFSWSAALLGFNSTQQLYPSLCQLCLCGNFNLSLCGNFILVHTAALSYSMWQLHLSLCGNFILVYVVTSFLSMCYQYLSLCGNLIKVYVATSS